MSVRRCSSAEGGSTFSSSALSRFCRLGTHILPSANSTWLTKPTILLTFTGWPLAEKLSVVSCKRRALCPGGRMRSVSADGSDPAMYCLPDGSLTIQPISTYFTGRLLLLRTSMRGVRASLPEIRAEPFIGFTGESGNSRKANSASCSGAMAALVTARPVRFTVTASCETSLWRAMLSSISRCRPVLPACARMRLKCSRSRCASFSQAVMVRRELRRSGPKKLRSWKSTPVSYTHLRAHETVLDLVCRLLLEKKKKQTNKINTYLLPKKPTNKTDNIQQNK